MTTSVIGPVIGTNAQTGAALDATAHILQSVGDILTTPRGSMPWLRTYGSDLFDLIDQPSTSALSALIRAATAIAITRWEPRLRLERVSFIPAADDGRAALSIDSVRLDTPRPQPFTFALNL